MRVLTVVFATLFLMGCPENDSATDVEAADAVQATDVQATDVEAADAVQATDVEAADVEVKAATDVEVKVDAADAAGE